MFDKISHSGIVMDNTRDMSISIMASSLFLPLIMADTMIMLFGLLIGGYYGWKIERQIHELRSLGGRIMKCKTFDYLMLS